MPVVLVVYHSASGGTRRLAEAVLAGTESDGIDDTTVRVVPPLEVTPDDVLGADGLLLGTPENLGYMSGAMKFFSDTIYYPCLEHTQGRPYGLFVKASTDGTGAIRAIERIVTGLGWNRIAEPLLVVGDVEASHLDAATELGATMCAGLEAGIY